MDVSFESAPLASPSTSPFSVETMQNGLAIRFSTPLDKETTEDADRFDLSQWNYRYSMNYGSDEYSVTDPSRLGQDEVYVRSATLLADRQTVFLEIPDIKPVMQLSIHYRLQTADLRLVDQTIAYTINALGTRRLEEADIVRRPRQVNYSDVESAIQPGLVLVNGDDRLVARQLAWAVPAGSARTLLTALSPPRQNSDRTNVDTDTRMSMTGYLKITTSGKYRFKMREMGHSSSTSGISIPPPKRTFSKMQPLSQSLFARDSTRYNS